jgi:hypothetical protein
LTTFILRQRKAAGAFSDGRETASRTEHGVHEWRFGSRCHYQTMPNCQRTLAAFMTAHPMSRAPIGRKRQARRHLATITSRGPAGPRLISRTTFSRIDLGR